MKKTKAKESKKPDTKLEKAKQAAYLLGVREGVKMGILYVSFQCAHESKDDEAIKQIVSSYFKAMKDKK